MVRERVSNGYHKLAPPPSIRHSFALPSLSLRSSFAFTSFFLRLAPLLSEQSTNDGRTMDGGEVYGTITKFLQDHKVGELASIFTVLNGNI